MIFIYYIYLIIYLFIYLLESYSIKLKRSIINVLLQIVFFQKVLNVSDMEYFMYPSMFRQLYVYSIVEESGRICLPGTLEASCWFSLDILLHTKSLPENFRFVSSWDLVPRFLCLYINDCFCL